MAKADSEWGIGASLYNGGGSSTDFALQPFIKKGEENLETKLTTKRTVNMKQNSTKNQVEIEDIPSDLKSSSWGPLIAGMFSSPSANIFPNHIFFHILLAEHMNTLSCSNALHHVTGKLRGGGGPPPCEQDIDNIVHIFTADKYVALKINIWIRTCKFISVFKSCKFVGSPFLLNLFFISIKLYACSKVAGFFIVSFK
jgi:hypothetical protein